MKLGQKWGFSSQNTGYIPEVDKSEKHVKAPPPQVKVVQLFEGVDSNKVSRREVESGNKNTGR